VPAGCLAVVIVVVVASDILSVFWGFDVMKPGCRASLSSTMITLVTAGNRTLRMMHF
jgi:hypothetical protein